MLASAARSAGAPRAAVRLFSQSSRQAAKVERISGAPRPPPPPPPPQSKAGGLSSPAATLALGVGLGIAIGSFIWKSGQDTAAAQGYDPLTQPQFGSREDVQTAIGELNAQFSHVQTDPEVIAPYGFSSNSYHGSAPHSAVVHVESTEDVVKVVNIARKYRVPLTVFAGGTSLEGHFGGYKSGSICIDMSGMDKILEINQEDSDLVCQAGARWEEINHTLEEKKIPLFFPLDPGPGAAIGGMIATGCSGTNAVKYGTAKGEWFLNLTVVLPNGEVIKTRRRAHKSSAGFDTTKLFIGAEGTLGIVTEATLRLAPLVPTRVAIAQFKEVEHAVSAVQEILHSPYNMNIQCVELVDDKMISAINASGEVPRKFAVKDSLFIKIQGSDVAIGEAAKVVRKIVEKHGASGWDFGSTEEGAHALWNARKSALWSSIASVPGSRAWTTDVCVPPSKLPQLVRETKEDMRQSNILGTIVGHVGDGNFHSILLFKNDEELENVREAVHRLVHRALRFDGTCTGEHGVGMGKKEYLVEELGPGTVELMKTVKRAVDPLGIMNPGKLYPDEDTRWKKK
ncbi:D-lactate dehydrogenase cytochrome oxidoreductase [Auricularia subglabra TFB-10046 SS5]|nr:D-lactate dehydrogenase cytochrome oxidoreductase [Auricularia subglabra TFB-10046 SS5]